jgi:hypothetical protein
MLQQKGLDVVPVDRLPTLGAEVGAERAGAA